MTFSSSFSQFRKIWSLKFTKRRRATKRCFIQPQQKLKRFPFSSNIKFSSQFSRFRQIPLLNFTKRRKATKTRLHSTATKTETIPIFFEHQIFVTIFSLSSYSITKLHWKNVERKTKSENIVTNVVEETFAFVKASKNHLIEKEYYMLRSHLSALFKCDKLKENRIKYDKTFSSAKKPGKYFCDKIISVFFRLLQIHEIKALNDV